MDLDGSDRTQLRVAAQFVAVGPRGEVNGHRQRRGHFRRPSEDVSVDLTFELGFTRGSPAPTSEAGA